jgi:hypothetical protein
MPLVSTYSSADYTLILCDPVKVVKVDFSNKQELVNAFRGNDAIVITIGDMANIEKNSKAIIDAAIEAGVKRVIPSEFGK